MSASERRLGRRDDGVALTEAAVVLPIIALIAFAIIELGFLFRTGSVSSAAARAGARVAASTYGDADTPAERTAAMTVIAGAVNTSLDGLSDQAEPIEILIYESTDAGTPASGTFDSCTASCAKFTWNGSTFQLTGGSGWADPDNCGVNIDRIGVAIRVQHEAFASFLAPTFSVLEHTVMRLEPGAFDVCTGE